MDWTFRALLMRAAAAVLAMLIPGKALAQNGAPIGAAAPLKLAQQRQAVTPGFFGTVAVPISARRFWAEWERARRDASALPQMQRLIGPARGLSRRQQIEFVQSAVARLIGWRSDTTQYGRHDYWASAAETLVNRRGDSEDRAILKMQALRSLGVPTRDLYLTLGRDTVGGPITVLIVRDKANFLVLDDTGGPSYAPARRPEFRPVLTFGYGASWVHKSMDSPAQLAAKASSIQKPANSESPSAPTLGSTQP